MSREIPPDLQFLNTIPVGRRQCPPCTGECEQGDACPARMTPDDGLNASRGVAKALPLSVAMWAAIALVVAVLSNPEALASVSAWLGALL